MRTFNPSAVAITLLVLLTNAAFADDDSPSKSPGTSETRSVDITVNESVVVDEDGKEKKNKTVSGRIIIKGPDGKVQEFNIGDMLPDGVEVKVAEDGDEEAFDITVLTAQDDEPRYMIGVVCSEADDTLRSHLDLGDSGLVVKKVSDKMPAAEAGVQVHDILLRIGDTKLATVQQMLKLVAGSEGKELTIEALRAGKKTEIKVTPKKFTAEEAMSDFEDGSAVKMYLRRKGVNGKALEELADAKWFMGPGLRLDGNTKVDVEEKLAEARARALSEMSSAHDEARKAHEKAMESHREKMQAHKERQANHGPPQIAKLQKQIEDLLQQQAEMAERLKALEKKE